MNCIPESLLINNTLDNDVKEIVRDLVGRVVSSLPSSHLLVSLPNKEETKPASAVEESKDDSGDGRICESQNELSQSKPHEDQLKSKKTCDENKSTDAGTTVIENESAENKLPDSTTSIGIVIEGKPETSTPSDSNRQEANANSPEPQVSCLTENSGGSIITPEVLASGTSVDEVPEKNKCVENTTKSSNQRSETSDVLVSDEKKSSNFKFSYDEAPMDVSAEQVSEKDEPVAHQTTTERTNLDPDAPRTSASVCDSTEIEQTSETISSAASAGLSCDQVSSKCLLATDLNGDVTALSRESVDFNKKNDSEVVSVGNRTSPVIGLLSEKASQFHVEDKNTPSDALSVQPLISVSRNVDEVSPSSAYTSDSLQEPPVTISASAEATSQVDDARSIPSTHSEGRIKLILIHFCF